jgi:hypothetical protein
MISNFCRLIAFSLLIIFTGQTDAEDPMKDLQDFENDRFNTVKDYLTGNYLTPLLPELYDFYP